MDPIRILFVEDQPEDADLAEIELRKGKIDFTSTRVCTEKTLLKALPEFCPDLVICDYAMPGFTGLEALKIILKHDETIPVIIFTGSQNEEVAVDCMKVGAIDYVLKDHIARLPFAVKDSLEKKRIFLAERKTNQALLESEEKYRKLIECIPAVTYTARLDETGGTLYVSPQVETLWGFSPEEWLADPDLWSKQLHPKDRERVLAEWTHSVTSGEPLLTEYRIMTRDGRVCWGRDEAVIIRNDAGKPLFMHGVVLDITERKHMEEALKDSEEKFRCVVEAANDGICIVQDAIIKYVNQELANLYGYSVEEIIGTNFAKYIHPDELEKVKTGYEKHMSGVETTQNYDSAVLNKDGRKIDVNLSTSLLTFEGSQAELALLRDITERKQAEEELKEKAVFVEQNPAPVFNVNHEGIIITVNKAAHKISKKFRTGESVYNIFKTITKSTIENQSDDKPIQIEETIGSTTFLFTVKKDAVTKAIYFFGSNISDLKQIEGKLRDAEANLKNIFDISPGLICVADTNTRRFTEANPAVTAILGISVGKFTSTPYMEFIHPDDRQRTVDTITKQPTGCSVANFENRYRCEDGSYKWLAWQATAADRDGKVYAVATDITEIKQTEEELKQRIEELEKFNDITVEREHVMIELKKEVNTLLNQLGGPDKYKIVE